MPAQMLADPDSGYTSFVGTGNVEITDADAPLPTPAKAAADADLSPEARRTVAGSRWSISASARRTPKPRPTISPCCARMPG